MLYGSPIGKQAINHRIFFKISLQGFVTIFLLPTVIITFKRERNT